MAQLGGALMVLGLSAAPLEAQCADGSPAPCRVARTRSTPPAAAVRARQFMVLPFRNVTRGEAQEWLVTGAPLMLGETLGRFREITVVPEEVLAAARRRAGISGDAPDATQLRRLAEETGAWTAILGDVIATGSSVRLAARALDISTATVIARASADVPKDADIPAAVNSLSLKLLEPSGVRASAQHEAAFATHSLDAYRAYARGHSAYTRSQYRVAQKEFNEAVRLDSTFWLAWVAVAANTPNIEGIEALANPFSGVYRSVERAARLVDRMPPRQARYIQGLHAFFRGEVRLGRRIIDSLAAADPDDLDTHFWLAGMELLTTLLDTTVSPPRLVASPNRALALARHILERDPGRWNVYLVPAFVYGISGGLWWGEMWGRRAERGTLAAMMIGAPEASFVPVLRDTLELIPSSRFDSLPVAERARLRARSVDAGAEMVERWLAAGPDDADAHLWASRFAELRGDYSRALRELAVADSLGVQSNLENVAGMRLSLLVLAGRYPEAAALVDSLLAAGAMRQRPMMRTLDRRRPYGAVAVLLAKRWETAARLGEQFGPATPTGPACTSLAHEMTGFDFETLPRIPVRAAMDTVAMHFAEASSVPGLARCVEALATLAVDSAARNRPRVAERLLAVADSLQRAGNHAVAYRAARVAWGADTARRPALVALPWFVERSQRLAIGRTFEPGLAVVTGDSVLFTLRRTSTESLEIDSPGLATNWSISIVASVDTTLLGVVLSHNAAPTDSGRRGGLEALIGSFTSTRATVAPTPANVTFPPPIVTAVGDELRILARGPLAAAFRSLRPDSVRFSSTPCIAVAEGLCRPRRVAINYR